MRLLFSVWTFSFIGIGVDVLLDQCYFENSALCMLQEAELKWCEVIYGLLSRLLAIFILFELTVVDFLIAA